MDQVVEYIYGSKILQAISIVVGVGTLVIFLWKNLNPLIIYLFNLVRFGIRKANIKAAKSIMRRSKIEYNDARLVMFTISDLSVRFFVRILTLPILYLIMILFVQILSLDKSQHDLDLLSFKSMDLIILPVVFCLAAAFAYYVFRPLTDLFFYARACRRYIFKDMIRGMRTSRGSKFEGSA